MTENGEIVYNGKTYKQVGRPEDVEKFEPQSLVALNLELKGSTYIDYPHGEHGVVMSKFHIEDDCYFHLPVVQFGGEKRMCNPEYLIIVQNADGSPGEVEKVKQMEINTAAARKKKQAEAK